MDKWEYTSFCSASSAFYTDRSSSKQQQRFSDIAAPSDWQVISTDAWETWIAPSAPVRTHGWKIHVGTTVGNMTRTLDAVVAACVETHATFKFVPTIHEYVNRNSKGADRSGSGKFATIYPTDDRQLARLARRLALALDGLPSPYILSDVRFRRGPVYFRYGGFIRITVRDESGTDVASIPGRLGVLTPDERSPRFVLPVGGARAPRLVREAIAQYELADETPLDDYDNLIPLHFSNSGGVYEALRDGENVSTTLLKEARPHAGLDRRGRDAVERLQIETSALQLLEATGVTPRVLNRFKAWEHEFLETEFLPGISAREWATTNYPFAVGGQQASTHQRYLDGAMRVVRNLINAMDIVHGHGIAIGDVHPGNVLVDDDLNVRFIDLEDSRGLDDEVAASMYAIGYAAPTGFTPRHADWFALSRTAASLFDISGALEILVPAHWDTMMTRIRRNFGAEAAELVHGITSRFPVPTAGTRLDFRPDVGVLPLASTSTTAGPPLTIALLSGVRKARRAVPGVLYPGDPTMFSGSGRWNTLTGLAGVRLAQRYGAPAREPSDMDVLRALVEGGATEPHLGLFSGEAGLLTHFEESESTHDLADRVRQHLIRSFRQERRSNLCDGLAGIGLGLLGHGLTSKHDEAVQAAYEIGELLVARLMRGRSKWAIDVLTERPGLFYGHSGVAVLFTALAQCGIGIPETFLAAAYECISRDLEHVSPYMDGMLGVKDGNRLLPYLAWGSSGIFVAIELLRRSPGYQDAFDERREGLVRACSSDTYAYSGLLFGRAGQIAALSMSPDPWDLAEAGRQTTLLPDELLTWEHEVFTAGENYLRLSTDYRSGNAGIVLALVAAAGAPLAWMPLSDPDHMFRTMAPAGGRAILSEGR